MSRWHQPPEGAAVDIAIYSDGRYRGSMARTITQAELRNSSARVMDELEAGNEFVITRNGRAVGELRPIAPRRDVGMSELKSRLARFAGASSSGDERAEIDTAFGEGRLDE
jgi:antitoxin (DNA-binding transcriptional repressor) of toxin-antitoxin stability system